MKRISSKVMAIMLCVASFAVMLSCNKNDDEDSSTNANIIGIWECVNFEFSSTKDSFEGAIVCFKEDGTYTASQSAAGFNRNGGTWMKDGNTLMLEGGGRSYVGHIEVLTQSSLKINIEVSDGICTQEFRRK